MLPKLRTLCHLYDRGWRIWFLEAIVHRCRFVFWFRVDGEGILACSGLCEFMNVNRTVNVIIFFGFDNGRCPRRNPAAKL